MKFTQRNSDVWSILINEKTGDLEVVAVKKPNYSYTNLLFVLNRLLEVVGWLHASMKEIEVGFAKTKEKDSTEEGNSDPSPRPGS